MRIRSKSICNAILDAFRNQLYELTNEVFSQHLAQVGFFLQGFACGRLRSRLSAIRQAMVSTFRQILSRKTACGEDGSVSNLWTSCVHPTPIAIVETTTWPLFVHAVEQKLL